MITDSTGKGAFYNVRGLAFVLIFLFLFNLIFYFIGTMTAGLYYHLHFSQVRELLSKPDGSAMAINIARFVNAVDLFGYMFMPVLLFSVVNRVSIVSEGNFRTKIQPPKLFLSVLIAALSLPLVEFLTKILKLIPLPHWLSYYAHRFEISRDASVNTILDMHQVPELIVCLLIVGLLPAVLEELMFRGVMLNIFKNITHGIWRPIIMQALVFAVLHFSFYQLPGIFLMGLLFGWVAIKTGTIWYGIVMHFIFNGTTIVLNYLNHLHFDKTGINGNYTNITLSPVMAVGAIAGIILLLRLFNKTEENETIHG